MREVVSPRYVRKSLVQIRKGRVINVDNDAVVVAIDVLLFDIVSFCTSVVGAATAPGLSERHPFSISVSISFRS